MRNAAVDTPGVEPSGEHDLGRQERAVLDAIAANPYVGQQDIATALGLARSTIAAHIGTLTRKGYILGRAYVLPESRRIVCLGGATLDSKFQTRAPLRRHTSNPVDGQRSFGGVARNVAESLARMGAEVSLVSAVGDDENGRALIRHLREIRVDTGRIVVAPGRRTAEYSAILGPDGALEFGLADMGVLDTFTLADLDRHWPHIAAAAWVFADCNLAPDVLSTLLTRRQTSRFRLAIDTVSTPKAARLPADLRGLDVMFLNRDEADAYLATAGREPAATPEAAAAALRDAGAAAVVLTLGADGLIVADGSGVTAVAAVPAASIDVTGAGDALIAATLFRCLQGEPIVDAARAGALLAALTTETDASVHPELSPTLLDTRMSRRAIAAIS
jgi:pseudouridine kinase